MTTVQFRYGTDNLCYLVHDNKFAFVVDGGAVDEILAYLNENKLELEFVMNTHSHNDHTWGNKELLEKSDAVLISMKEILLMEEFSFHGDAIKVIHTPGHTRDSVCFYYENILLAGDTLFNGKVGRCFTEDYESFFHSIKKLLLLPGETLLYAGHDYVLEYLKLAEKLEPDNCFLPKYRKEYNPDDVRAMLSMELKIDPFIRFNEPAIIDLLIKKGLPVETEFHRFKSIISLM